MKINQPNKAAILQRLQALESDWQREKSWHLPFTDAYESVDEGAAAELLSEGGTGLHVRLQGRSLPVTDLDDLQELETFSGKRPPSDPLAAFLLSEQARVTDRQGQVLPNYEAYNIQQRDWTETSWNPTTIQARFQGLEVDLDKLEQETQRVESLKPSERLARLVEAFPEDGGAVASHLEGQVPADFYKAYQALAEVREPKKIAPLLEPIAGEPEFVDKAAAITSAKLAGEAEDIWKAYNHLRSLKVSGPEAAAALRDWLESLPGPYDRGGLATQLGEGALSLEQVKLHAQLISEFGNKATNVFEALKPFGSRAQGLLEELGGDEVFQMGFSRPWQTMPALLEAVKTLEKRGVKPEESLGLVRDYCQVLTQPREIELVFNFYASQNEPGRRVCIAAAKAGYGREQTEVLVSALGADAKQVLASGIVDRELLDHRDRQPLLQAYQAMKEAGFSGDRVGQEFGRARKLLTADRELDAGKLLEGLAQAAGARPERVEDWYVAVEENWPVGAASKLVAEKAPGVSWKQALKTLDPLREEFAYEAAAYLPLLTSPERRQATAEMVTFATENLQDSDDVESLPQVYLRTLARQPQRRPLLVSLLEHTSVQQAGALLEKLPDDLDEARLDIEALVGSGAFQSGHRQPSGYDESAPQVFYDALKPLAARLGREQASAQLKQLWNKHNSLDLYPWLARWADQPEQLEYLLRSLDQGREVESAAAAVEGLSQAFPERAWQQKVKDFEAIGVRGLDDAEAVSAALSAYGKGFEPELLNRYMQAYMKQNSTYGGVAAAFAAAAQLGGQTDKYEPYHQLLESKVPPAAAVAGLQACRQLSPAEMAKRLAPLGKMGSRLEAPAAEILARGLDDYPEDPELPRLIEGVAGWNISQTEATELMAVCRSLEKRPGDRAGLSLLLKKFRPGEVVELFRHIDLDPGRTLPRLQAVMATELLSADYPSPRYYKKDAYPYQVFDTLAALESNGMAPEAAADYLAGLKPGRDGDEMLASLATINLGSPAERHAFSTMCAERIGHDQAALLIPVFRGGTSKLSFEQRFSDLEKAGFFEQSYEFEYLEAAYQCYDRMCVQGCDRARLTAALKDFLPLGRRYDIKVQGAALELFEQRLFQEGSEQLKGLLDQGWALSEAVAMLKLQGNLPIDKVSQALEPVAKQRRNPGVVEILHRGLEEATRAHSEQRCLGAYRKTLELAYVEDVETAEVLSATINRLLGTGPSTSGAFLKLLRSEIGTLEASRTVTVLEDVAEHKEPRYLVENVLELKAEHGQYAEGATLAFATGMAYHLKQGLEPGRAGQATVSDWDELRRRNIHSFPCLQRYYELEAGSRPAFLDFCQSLKRPADAPLYWDLLQQPLGQLTSKDKMQALTAFGSAGRDRAVTTYSLFSKMVLAGSPWQKCVDILKPLLEQLGPLEQEQFDELLAAVGEQKDIPATISRLMIYGKPDTYLQLVSLEDDPSEFGEVELDEDQIIVGDIPVDINF